MKLTIRSALMGAALSLIAGAAFAQANSTATGTGAAQIITPIAVTQTTGLDFGTIIKPASPSATVTAQIAADSTGTASGATWLASAAAPHSAVFHVTGQDGYAFSITTDPTLTLSDGANNLSVTLLTSDTSGTLGQLHSTTAGEANYYVGGTMAVSGSTVSGTYNGNFSTAVAYN